MSTPLIMIATCIVAFAIGRLAALPTIHRLRAALADASWRLAHDPLTDLLSRTGLLDAHTHDTTAASQPTQALLIDLDNFKPVNDTHGHGTGDDLLVEIADRIAGTATVLGGKAARLSGDEFAVLLPIRGHEPATVAALFGIEIAQPIELSNGDTPITIAVTASIGVVIAEPGDPLELLTLRRADIAMYHAKRAGGNRYTLYEPGMAMPITQPRLGPRLRELRQHRGVTA